MWHRAESRGQGSKSDGKQIARILNIQAASNVCSNEKVELAWPHKAYGMWQRAESRGQVSKADGKHLAQTNSTSYTNCRDRKKVTPNMTTQGTWYVAEPWESKVLMRNDQQHYKRTPHIDFA